MFGRVLYLVFFSVGLCYASIKFDAAYFTMYNNSGLFPFFFKIVAKGFFCSCSIFARGCRLGDRVTFSGVDNGLSQPLTFNIHNFLPLFSLRCKC